ncbi:MAG TPA: DUF4255 domain-containing protein [Candidatus Angelobacter sp.]|nr:DUF4255 domain-containing protein [Candidatus Angelobacter sp.]
MSNYLSVATVTATLRQIVLQALQAVPKVSGDVQVRTGKPENPSPGFVGANLYLYRIMPNNALRHKEPIPKRAAGILRKGPVTALDLYYVLSFYGDEKQQEPERFLGSAIMALHRQPTLTAELIRQTVANAAAGSYLAESDLQNQSELVRFSLQTLSADELARTWGLFARVAYAPSVFYKGSAVVLAG